MNATVDYYARQVAGSRVRLLVSIVCQIGAFIFLVSGVGWRSAMKFGFFMVLLPSLYLWIIYGMSRSLSRRSDEAQS
jgi:hypothetical protein